MAVKMQSYELAIMLAVATALKDVPIAAWMHDGLHYNADLKTARVLAQRADLAAAEKSRELLESAATLEHRFAERRGRRLMAA